MTTDHNSIRGYLTIDWSKRQEIYPFFFNGRINFVKARPGLILSVCLFVCRSACQSVSVCLSVCQSACLSVCVCLSVCLSAHLCLFGWLSVRLPLSLRVPSHLRTRGIWHVVTPHAVPTEHFLQLHKAILLTELLVTVRVEKNETQSVTRPAAAMSQFGDTAEIRAIAVSAATPQNDENSRKFW